MLVEKTLFSHVKRNQWISNYKNRLIHLFLEIFLIRLVETGKLLIATDGTMVAAFNWTI